MQPHPRPFVPATGAIAARAFAPFLAAALSLSVPCTAQDARPSHAVDGVVLDRLTHQPIARVLVGGQNDAVLTDNEGRFELHLPLGVVSINARRPGYLGYENGMTQTVIEVREETPAVTLYLTPSATILGHIALSSGDATDGLRVQLYQKYIEEGCATWRQTGAVAAGSDGAFRFPALDAPGSYVLCGSALPDFPILPDQKTPITGYPALCYPGGTDLRTAMAAPFRLSPGQQAQVEISLSRELYYPVSIAVGGGVPEGSPAPFPSIFDRNGNPAALNLHLDQRTGTAAALLPNGSYYAEVRTWGTTPSYGRTDFTVAGAPLAGITVVRSPLPPLIVEVRTEFTATPQQQERRITIANGNGPRISINLRATDRPLEGEMGTNLRTPPGSTDNDLYEMDPPAPGSYWVQARGYGPDVYVNSLTSGNADLLSEPLVIGPGSSTPPIQVTLRNDVGFLICQPKTQSTAAPNAGAEFQTLAVHAIPQFVSDRPIYQTIAPFSTGSQMIGTGNSRLSLPPGNYLVLAFDHVHDVDVDDKEELSRLAAQGQTVTIAPGATTQLQVEPIVSSGPEVEP